MEKGKSMLTKNLNSPNLLNKFCQRRFLKLKIAGKKYFIIFILKIQFPRSTA